MKNDKGILYIVATPIGNLKDITFRAVEVLAAVDYIAVEDARVSYRLLKRYDITNKTLLSCHDSTSDKAKILKLLNEGIDVALISDAGTPLISDPGFDLVRMAVAANIGVIPVPGPSSVIAALSASGLCSEKFLFYGFLPNKHSQRRRELETLRSLTFTIIFLESVHRIIDTLDDLRLIWPSSKVVIARELTKMYEEYIRGSIEEVMANCMARNKMRGEFVIMLEPTLVEENYDYSDLIKKLWLDGYGAKQIAVTITESSPAISKSEAYDMALCYKPETQ